MANISYGVNLLPKTNNAYTLGNSDYKWSNIYTVQLNGINVEDLGTSDLATTTTPGLMSAADKAKLDTLSAFNATDYTVNIATTDWVNNSYTWTNSAVTSTAYIIVNFTESVKNYVKGTLDYTKVTGGVQFNVESTPTGAITLIIGVIDGASGTSTGSGGADIDDTVTSLNKTWSSSKIDEQVIISSTQPSVASNKLWISNDNGTEVTVPTYSEFTTLANAAITDVKINNTSVVTSGIANIPILTDDGVYGVTTTNWANGISLDTNNALVLVRAGESDAKNGSTAYKACVPYWQHLYTFYGLAKAAGDTTQSQSSNAAGIYTNEAKIAIQKMLGIYEAPWELIREDTVTNSTSQELIISVDDSGNSFQLTDAVVIAIIPTQNTDFTMSDYCRVYFRKGETNIRNGFLVNNQSKTFSANSSIYVGFATFMQEHGLLTLTYTEFAIKSTHAYPRITTTNSEDDTNTPYGIKSTYIDSIKISEFVGTLQYRILGRRKWN